MKALRAARSGKMPTPVTPKAARGAAQHAALSAPEARFAGALKVQMLAQLRWSAAKVLIHGRGYAAHTRKGRAHKHGSAPRRSEQQTMN